MENNIELLEKSAHVKNGIKTHNRRNHFVAKDVIWYLTKFIELILKDKDMDIVKILKCKQKKFNKHSGWK